MSNPTGFKIYYCNDVGRTTSTTYFDFDDIYVRKEIFSSGGVWTWGNGTSGQLGNNSNISRCIPGKICCNRLDWRDVVTSRFSGNHAGALQFAGAVSLWGGNDAYQLGTGTTTSISQPCFSPGQANNLSAFAIKKISIGGGVTSLLNIKNNDVISSNTVLHNGFRTAFGCNANQRAGINSTNTTITSLFTTLEIINWNHLSHGNGFAVGVGQLGGCDDNYHLLVFGDNTAGQLGTGDTVTRNTPVCVSTDWYCVSAGNNHSLGIKRDGTLWAWGCNSFGQLGNGTTINSSTPIQIGCDKKWKYVSAGGDFSVAVTCGDATSFHSQIWTWGLNSSGQLGDNTTVNKSSPVQTADLLSSWKKVSAGDTHVLALKSDGTIWAWGTNSQGELGDGTTVSKSSPIQVGTANKWLSISAGKCFSAGIREDSW